MALCGCSQEEALKILAAPNRNVSAAMAQFVIEGKLPETQTRQEEAGDLSSGSDMTLTGQAMALHSRPRLNPVPSVVNRLSDRPIRKVAADTLVAARDYAQSRLKWLLVLVDDPVQVVHPDVVLDDGEVKRLVRRHFVLWEVESSSLEGRDFITLYHCVKLPRLSILDPRTGEEIWSSSRLKLGNVLASLQHFLKVHRSFAQYVDSSKISELASSSTTCPEMVDGLTDSQLGKRQDELTTLKLHFLSASGEDEQTLFRWPSDTKLQKLRLHICENLQHIPQEGYKLICLQPRLTLETIDDQSTLEQLGLHPSANLHLTFDNGCNSNKIEAIND
ncbi:UBX domain-containing protein 7-like [Drosophila willistoni]|uniref:UBX domain-containing protein 7-like n=1 Tax=Drosophila willistoni TaxID=7260 RepID=UPI00017D9D47|nr:UBX domain-containing protein 7-like [Drosophila willistoni]